MAFVNTEDINVAAMWSIWPRCLREQCRNKQKGCRVIAVDIKWTDGRFAEESWEQRFGFMYKAAIFFLQFQILRHFVATLDRIEIKFSQLYSEIVLVQTLCPRTAIWDCVWRSSRVNFSRTLRTANLSCCAAEEGSETAAVLDPIERSLIQIASLKVIQDVQLYQVMRFGVWLG